MQKYVYQVGNEYFTILAYDLHQAMMDVACEGGVVIGNYTDYAHIFGE